MTNPANLFKRGTATPAAQTPPAPARARRIPVLARIVAVVAVVAACTGGAWAYALTYHKADYSWLDSLDSPSYTIATAGQMQALSNIVDGTWTTDELALGVTGEEADERFALPEDVQDALFDQEDGAYGFAGKTVRLGGSLDFLLGLGTIKPIGTAEHAFDGTFDGNGRDIGSLRITNVPEDPQNPDPDEPLAPLQCVGLFGHVGPQGSVQNLTLGRGCEIDLQATGTQDHIAYVGSLVGWCEGSIDNCESRATVNVSWDDGNGGDDRYAPGDYVNTYVADGVGGIAGYADGDVTGATFKGNVKVNTPANAAWVAEADSNEAVVVRYVGGIVGRSGGDPTQAGVAGATYGTLANCANTGDVTVETTGAGGQDRFGETVDSKSQYVGGIAGYAIGDIVACTNAGDIVATSHAYDAGLSQAQNDEAYRAADGGADCAGGIVGGYRSMGAGGAMAIAVDGPAYNDNFTAGGIKVDRGIVGEQDSGTADIVQISDCQNTGRVIACNNVGGIAGATGTYTRVYRCANGDAKRYAQDDTIGYVLSVRWNKPCTGGIVGRSYGDVAYSRNHGEVQTSKGGYYVGGLVGDLYYYRNANNDKFVTPEVYACYNTGQVVCTKTYRRGALLGGNGGYIHDCLFLFGTSSAAEDEGIFAIGQEKGEDNPLKANLAIAYASDSQAASHGEGAFSLKSAQAVAWLNNAAMRTDSVTGETGWGSGVYYMATPGANRGYPVLFAEGLKSTTTIDLAALDPAVALAQDAAYTTAFNPTPKLNVTVTVDGAQKQLVENADYYVVPDPAALDENGVCKGTTNGERIYTARVCGIGNYASEPFGSVAYAIGQGDFAECSISATTDTYTGEALRPNVTVLDPAGGVVDPGDYTFVVNDGKGCVAPGTYAVVATANKSSNYAGHCSGTYAIAKINIASDCDVVGVAYDQAEHGGIDASLADDGGKPRVWFYDDETYRVYEVKPVLDARGQLQTYTAADIADLRAGGTWDAGVPDEVAAGFVGYPKVEGLVVYREDDGDRWLSRATPARTDDAGAAAYGMELEYTAGELRPQVIGVNWAQGKLQFQNDDGTTDVPWRVIYGGGSGGSTSSRENARAAEGTLNIESSATGAVTVARHDTGHGTYLTNYDVITFGITPANVGRDELDVSMDGTKTVYKVGEAVSAPAVTVRYKGNVVDKANYTMAVDRVTDAAGFEVSRRTAYQEGDTVYYKLSAKGSLSCDGTITTDNAGNAICCVVVKDQTALTAERFDVVFEGEGWERIEDGSSVDKWKKRFTLGEGIDTPMVRLFDTQAADAQGTAVRKELTLGKDYRVAFNEVGRTGGWRLGGPSPSVQVVGMNEYAGTLMVRYRVEKGVLTQDDLDKMAAGVFANADGEQSAKIAGVDGWRATDGGRNASQTIDQWLPQFGPYVAYRPHGYTPDELAGRIGVAFATSTAWGCGYDAELFDVARIEKGGVQVEKATAPGMYTVTLVAREQGWGAYRYSNVSGSLFFDVERGASVDVDIEVVAPNLTVADWNVYEHEGGRARVSMMDYSSLRLSLVDSRTNMFAYTNVDYPYTGNPVKPRYLLRDNDTSSSTLLRKAGSRADGLETDEEVLARLQEHLFDYDDYEVVVEGYESAGGCPTDTGEGYQVVAVAGSGTGTLSGRYDVLNISQADNVYSIVAADISDAATVGIAVGDAETPNDPSSNVGYLGPGGAKPEVRFYVDSDGNGTYDADERCAYVEGEDYEVEYLNARDVTDGPTATARIYIKDTRHLSASTAGAYDVLRGQWYYDVPFRVEGAQVVLNDPSAVTWSGLPESLVVADTATGAISQSVGEATYKLGEGAQAIDATVPASAYSLVAGTVEDGTFEQKGEGWKPGDTAWIAVQPTSASSRFVVDGARTAVIGSATVVAPSAENDFSAVDSKLQAQLDAAELAYAGVPLEPVVSVVDGAGNALVAGADFSVTYAQNVNAGDATATVQGLGAYAGSRTLRFRIAKLDLATCVTTGADQSYTGAQVCPSAADVIVKTAAGVALPADVAGWEVDPDAYGENLNAGAGRLAVRATADGNLAGRVAVSFAITGRSLSQCSIPPFTAQPKATPTDGRAVTASQFAEGDVVVTDETLGRSLVLGADFEVVGVSNADGFANTEEDTATGSVSYVGYATLTLRGLGNYAGVATANVPLASKSLAGAQVTFAEGEGGPYDYTGQAVKPDVVVALDGKTLELGVDYTLRYAGNVNAGTASVTVVGMGAYRNTTAAQALTFEIVPVQVVATNAEFVLASDELAYTALAASPSGVLTLRGERIASGNVELSFERLEGEGGEERATALAAAPADPGAYRVTARAVKGNLLGSASADFRIVAASLSACTLSIDRGEYAFGAEVCPGVSIVMPGKGQADPADVGCTVSYSCVTGEWAVGDEAYATVTADADSSYFEGEVSQPFSVSRILLTRADVDFADYTELAYTGTQVTPVLSVNVAGRALSQGSDFDVVALSTDLVNPGAKTLEVATPATSVYEARDVLVNYVIGEKPQPQYVVPGGSGTGGAGSGTGGTTAKPSASTSAAKTTQTTTGKTAKPVTVKVTKAANTMVAKVKKKTVKLKYAKLKKKRQVVANLRVTKARGKVTYKNVSAQKKAKKFKVTSKGKVIVPKKTKKGTYKLKVRVTAKGTAKYKAKSKTVVFKVKVV